MNASENITEGATIDVAEVPLPLPLLLPPSPPPCTGTGFPDGDCFPVEMSKEARFLAVTVPALAVITCVLCILACMLTVLVHKLSAMWAKLALRPAVSVEPCDDPRKGLLQDAKSSLRSSDKAEGKKKKASFADENTSCAPARDVDEEDL
mgnify:CR=1 FL=1